MFDIVVRVKTDWRIELLVSDLFYKHIDKKTLTTVLMRTNSIGFIIYLSSSRVFANDAIQDIISHLQLTQNWPTLVSLGEPKNLMKIIPVVAKSFHQRVVHGHALLDLDDVSSTIHLGQIPFSL